MIFREARLAGCYVIELERDIDERGGFARLWCAREMQGRGLDARLVQASISTNRRSGTLRGMHYSVVPHTEVKVVRCVRGAIYDVALDLRATSPTYGRWFAETLTADNGLAMYIPEGVAHGFQTLADATDVLYQMSAFFEPAFARGVRWDDPAFGIVWPSAERTMSERDRTFPDHAPLNR